MFVKIPLEKTRKGYPALWESGGGMSNTGDATIVAGSHGERLRPVYVRRRGHLAGGDHALFIVRPGMVVVEADHHRRDFRIRVMRIERITQENGHPVAIARVEHVFDAGDGDAEPPPELEAAVQAAREKATCYHCRAPHYAAEASR